MGMIKLTSRRLRRKTIQPSLSIMLRHRATRCSMPSNSPRIYSVAIQSTPLVAFQVTSVNSTAEEDIPDESRARRRQVG